jgi:hypothetical protein
MTDGMTEFNPAHLAANIILAHTEGAGDDPVERLGGSDEARKFIALIEMGVSEGFAAGQLSTLPEGSDRLRSLSNVLRSVHAKEMFGDCTEDGDHYPCKTVRALDIVGVGA